MVLLTEWRKIHKTILSVLYGCEMWFLNVWENINNVTKQNIENMFGPEVPVGDDKL
jgi:hypothetical protein